MKYPWVNLKTGTGWECFCTYKFDFKTNMLSATQPLNIYEMTSCFVANLTVRRTLKWDGHTYAVLYVVLHNT